MTDEEFIIKFLNRNYVLIAKNDNIVFKEIDTEKTFFNDEFRLLIGNILGPSLILSKTINTWYDNLCRTLLADLYSFFDSLDLSKKSIECMKDINIFCHTPRNGVYSPEFVNKYFNEFYSKKLLNKITEDLKTKINLDYHSSNNMFNLLQSQIEGENSDVYETIMLFINEWYFDNVMNGKLKAFIERSQLILGPTNWLIKNLDYGTMEFEKIWKCFPDETPYQKSMIKKILEKWYEEEIYIASEKAMKNIWY